MPEGEIHMVDKINKMEGRSDDLSYVQRLDRNDSEKRLKMLFRPEEEGRKGDEEIDAAEAIKDAYMTVNEGETTDTTSGFEDDLLLTRSKDADDKKKPAAGQGKAKADRAVEEGIKSSDDEEQEDDQQAAVQTAPKQDTVSDRASG